MLPKDAFCTGLVSEKERALFGYSCRFMLVGGGCSVEQQFYLPYSRVVYIYTAVQGADNRFVSEGE